MGAVYEHEFVMPDLDTCGALSVHLHEVIASELGDDGAIVFSTECVENVNE